MQKGKVFTTVFFGLILVFAMGCSNSSGGGEQTGTPANNGAANEASAFPEQDITLIVPYPAGGGFDKLARQIAPYLQENLPNDVNVIVKNVPGGNSVMGINQVLNAKPDGHTIGIFNLPGHLVGQIATEQYDLSKLAWIGQAVIDPQVAVASPQSGFTSLKDIQAAGNITMAAAGLTGTDGLGAVASSKELGFEMNLLTPGGANDALLALMRGDAHLSLQPYASVKSLIEAKEVVPIWVFANKRLEGLPDVPTIVEEGYDHASLISINNLRRAFATSGEVNEDRLNVLRTAFQEAVEDPELRAEIAKGGTPITYASGDELKQTLTVMIGGITPFTKELKQASGN